MYKIGVDNHPEAYEEHSKYVKENHGKYELRDKPIDIVTHEIELDFYIPNSRLHKVQGNAVRFGLFGKRVPKTVEMFLEFINSYNAQFQMGMEYYDPGGHPDSHIFFHKIIKGKYMEGNVKEDSFYHFEENSEHNGHSHDVPYLLTMHKNK